MILTEHFDLWEFLHSDYAVRFGINNIPPAPALEELRRLANVMETVRAVCGDRPIRISSGYRAPALNSAVGGSPNSAHVEGRAADFLVVGLDIPETARAITQSVIDYDQLIHEGMWVHLAIPPKKKPGRRGLLRARFTAGRASYTPWDLS